MTDEDQRWQCLVFARDVCAIWDSTISFWELIITVLFTAAVTAGTVAISVSMARRETNRVLDAQRKTDLEIAVQDVIATFAARVQRQTVSEIIGNAAEDARYTLALGRVRASDLPWARDAADWVESADSAHLFLDGSESFDLDKGLDNAMFRRSPSTTVGGALLQWLLNPDENGPRFREEHEKMQEWIKLRIRQELEREEENKRIHAEQRRAQVAEAAGVHNVSQDGTAPGLNRGSE